MIKESRTYGILCHQSILRRDMSETSGVVTLLPAGALVEVLRDKSEVWYLVRDSHSGKQGWLHRESLTIAGEQSTEESRMNKHELETFANTMGYTSRTKFLVIVDISRQLTHVFKGAKNKWAHLTSITVSTGKNESPTIRGEFTLIDRGLWFYSERLGSGGKFWVRFDGPYLFHSVAMDKSGAIIDDTLGKKSSNGCIRMSVPDAEWFYKNIPDKTKVIII